MSTVLLPTLAREFNAASEIANVADKVKEVDISPIVSGVTGLVPMMLGAIVVGVGIRKLISWARKALSSI